MQQINISVDVRFAELVDCFQFEIGKISQALTCVKTYVRDRVYFSIAFEGTERKAVLRSIHTAIAYSLSKFGKAKYLSERINARISPCNKRILVKALTEYNRIHEQEIIERSFCLSENMAIDGIYNFRLSEVKTVWKDLIRLSNENSVYLADNEVFVELISFLFSSLEPVYDKILLDKSCGNYIAKDLQGTDLFCTDSVEDLIVWLIENVPVSIAILKSFDERGTIARIENTLGLKPAFMSV